MGSEMCIRDSERTRPPRHTRIREQRRIELDVEVRRPEPGPADVRRAYGSANHDRLRELKRRFDPTNLFRRNANILPADGALAER